MHSFPPDGPKQDPPLCASASLPMRDLAGEAIYRTGAGTLDLGPWNAGGAEFPAQPVGEDGIEG